MADNLQVLRLIQKKNKRTGWVYFVLVLLVLFFYPKPTEISDRTLEQVITWGEYVEQFNCIGVNGVSPNSFGINLFPEGEGVCFGIVVRKSCTYNKQKPTRTVDAMIVSETYCRYSPMYPYGFYPRVFYHELLVFLRLRQYSDFRQAPDFIVDQ